MFSKIYILNTLKNKINSIYISEHTIFKMIARFY